LRKLLIADDEPGIRSLVRVTLQSDRYEIVEAGDGEEALALSRQHLPDLLLLDVMMPKRSGLDVCRILKDDPTTAGITVILLTARAGASDIKQGEEAGSDGYFMKPFSPVELMRKVNDVLFGGPGE
jgi:two-component system phosphate regulon response regulator PhoB